MSFRAHILSVVLVASVSSVSFGQDLEFNAQTFSLPLETEKLIVVDLNNDQRNDLLAVMEDRLRIYFQQDTGFDFETAYDDLVFAEQAIGWDISAGYSNDGSAAIVSLIDGRQVKIWRAQANRFLPADELNADFNGFLGKGINRLRFSQDVNGDGLEDLVIPGAGSLNIHIQINNNTYQPPLSIESDFRIRTNLVSSRLDRRVGQAVRIPTLELRDVNNDGSDDLISRTEERLNVFLAQSNQASYFNIQPSYTLDIAEIEERLGEFDIDNLDFSNLTGILALTHEEILEDVDGDGIEDFLLREGGKVSFFAGTKTGMNFEAPRQILRSGGNVLSTFLYDENEDGLKDLWLWRVEPISVGDIFVWLALSGSIAVEAFVYPNEGERFARRPARKVTIDLKFPSVIRLTSAFRDLDENIASATQTNNILSAQANIKTQNKAEDLVVFADNQLSLFFNVLESDAKSDEFLGSLGYSRERDNYEIDLRNILDQVRNEGDKEREIFATQSPDFVVSDLNIVNGSDVQAVELNNDGIDDIMVFENPNSGDIKGILLLSNQL